MIHLYRGGLERAAAPRGVGEGGDAAGAGAESGWHRVGNGTGTAGARVTRAESGW